MARQRRIADIVGRNTEYTRQFVASGRADEAMSKTIGEGGSRTPSNPAERVESSDHTADTVAPGAVGTSRTSEQEATATPDKEVSAPPPAGSRLQAINLVAYPKREHAADLRRLEGMGYPAEDVVKLAGKRASKRFAPDRRFVPMVDAERLPRAQAFYTSKRIPTGLLDALRSGHDPLGIKSADTLLRGQFEPIFWAELEGLISELSKQG